MGLKPSDINGFGADAKRQILEQLSRKTTDKSHRRPVEQRNGVGEYKNTPKEEMPRKSNCDAQNGEIGITVNLKPVTKKNSQRIVKRGNRHIPLPSEAFANYEKEAENDLAAVRDLQIDYPVEVKCLFYMPTKRRVDLTNLLEAIDDVLVHYGVLADDNSQIIVSHDGSRVLYDKEEPRTEITIRKVMI